MKRVVVTDPGGAPAWEVAGRPGQAPAPAAAAPHGWRPGVGRIRLRLFGEFAFQTFTASQSFKAIFGSSTGFFYGGGVDMTFEPHPVAERRRHALPEDGRAGVRVERRVVSAGRRRARVDHAHHVQRRRIGSAQKGFTPYVGGGAGAVVYRETSDFANADENVSKTGTAFQVLGGVELPLGQHLSAAVEGQYQGVTGILGDTGVSQVFNENGPRRLQHPRSPHLWEVGRSF